MRQKYIDGKGKRGIKLTTVTQDLARKKELGGLMSKRLSIEERLGDKLAGFMENCKVYGIVNAMKVYELEDVGILRLRDWLTARTGDSNFGYTALLQLPDGAKITDYSLMFDQLLDAIIRRLKNADDMEIKLRAEVTYWRNKYEVSLNPNVTKALGKVGKIMSDLERDKSELCGLQREKRTMANGK